MEDKDYFKDTEQNPGQDTEQNPGQDAQNKNEDQDKEQEYDRFCFLCHRPESQTGKLITLAQAWRSARTACRKPWIRSRMEILISQSCRESI